MSIDEQLGQAVGIRAAVDEAHQRAVADRHLPPYPHGMAVTAQVGSALTPHRGEVVAPEEAAG